MIGACAVLTALMAVIPCANADAEMGCVNRSVIRAHAEKVRRETAKHGDMGGCGALTDSLLTGEPAQFAAVNIRTDLTVWPQTSVVLRLTNGQEIHSLKILAARDKCGAEVLDNTEQPYNVSWARKYKSNWRLYVKFPVPVPFGDVESWELR